MILPIQVLKITVSHRSTSTIIEVCLDICADITKQLYSARLSTQSITIRSGLHSVCTHQTYGKQSKEEVEEEPGEDAEEDASWNGKCLQA